MLMDILPESVDRLMYLDVDLIINGSIEEFSTLILLVILINIFLNQLGERYLVIPLKDELELRGL